MRRVVRDFSVATPESVDFSLDVAGIGSRFLAVFLDTTIQSAVMFALLLGSAFLRELIPAPLAESFVQAFLVVLAFVVYWGYFVFFETVWNGQTPGKRRIGLRAVKQSGLPMTFLDVLVRNILRIVDFLPLFYGLGVLFMFIGRGSRRIGDLAAGTLVIKEKPLSLSEVGTRADVSNWERGLQDPAILGRVRRLNHEETQLLRTFLERRFRMDPEARRRIAERLAGLYLRLLGLDGEELESREAFLEEVLRAKAG